MIKRWTNLNWYCKGLGEMSYSSGGQLFHSKTGQKTIESSFKVVPEITNSTKMYQIPRCEYQDNINNTMVGLIEPQRTSRTQHLKVGACNVSIYMGSTSEEDQRYDLRLTEHRGTFVFLELLLQLKTALGMQMSSVILSVSQSSCNLFFCLIY